MSLHLGLGRHTRYLQGRGHFAGAGTICRQATIVPPRLDRRLRTAVA